MSHPFSLAFALSFAARLHQFRREGQAAQERAEAVITLSTEQGFPYWLAWGTILRGWALAEQGQGEEGIAQMRQGLAAYRATGAEIWTAVLSCPAGRGVWESRAGRGRTERAGRGAGCWWTKLGSVSTRRSCIGSRGELTLQQVSQKSKVKGQRSKVTDPRPLTPDPQGEAEACFLKAIEIARKQQAKSLELRAATSLARLWQQQGKQHEAHKMLSEIYNWFTEGI